MEEGQQNNVEPFYLPEDAFFEMEEAYIWRGRVRKRPGSSYIGVDHLSSRFRIQIGTTAAVTGNLGATVVPGAVFEIGQMFSIGNTVFTVNATGAPSTLLTTGSATGTYDTTTGTVTITGNTENPSTAVFFYPAQPVMGLRTRESDTVNLETVIGFDTQFAYTFNGTSWSRLGSAVWTGSDAQFFWSTNYRGANPYETYFYTVNFNAADNIKYIPSGSSTWTNLRPRLDNATGTPRFLETCRVLLPFKDRLVALNTIEDENGTDRSYPNRCRFSQNGDPTNATNSWIDDTAGRGGFLDAPTQEQIVTAEYIKDRLIVYFERSTWELVYVGNTALPFRWQQLNNELGCESTFSVVGFDTAILGVGNVGVHTTNGINVKRIDEKIPDEVFNIHNGNSGPQRVYGIRDYYNEVVYWTFPDSLPNPTYPTRNLLYNYRNNTWAFFNDSFTCYGYYQDLGDLSWSDLGEIYGTWDNWNNPWGSPLNQSAFPFVIAGNQEGFVFIINNGLSSNAPSLYVTDMNAATEEITVINHNLMEGDYVLVEEAEGITSLNDTVFQVQEVVNADTLILDTTFSGTYTGNGTLRRISNLRIFSKQFNPGTPVGQQFRIPYVDFLLNRTTNGEISLDYLIDTASGDSIQDEVSSGILLGSNVLYTKVEDTLPFQVNAQQIWHRYYIQSQAAFLQLLFYMSDSQMRDITISQSDFELHAMILYAEPQGRITG